MSKRVTIEELKSYLWNSAVLLRTHIDAGSYKQYIFPLLFFKRISDVYDEECAAVLAEYGEEVDFPENHRFVVPKGSHWRDVREVHENVGTAIINAFRSIERANSEKLSGVFGDGAWTNKNRLPDELLKNMIEHFSTLTLTIENCPEDELGQGYEYLIRKFADDSGHTAQEFYTNRTVVHLMTEMLKPQPGEAIYDPTCGSAGMLISAIAYLKAREKEWRNVKIFGQEINALTSAIARMNLFLHGVKDFQIVNDDTLIAPAFIENGKLQQFDIVVANPPYSINQWNREAFAADKYGRNFLGTPTQGRADYAFFQHILKSLSTATGRCAILFPHGVLFRNEEVTLRENLILSDLVECVIGLGANLFYNSPMEACIIICRTNKSPDRRGQILIINAVNEVTRKNAFSFLNDSHIKKIADAYEQYVTMDGFAQKITIADAKQNGWSLSIPLYVRETANADAVDMRSVAECAASWINAAYDMRLAYDDLQSLLEVKEFPSTVYPFRKPDLLMAAEQQVKYVVKDNDSFDGGNADESKVRRCCK